MESNAKILKICDNCKASLKGDRDRSEHITATLNGKDGKNQTFHMCSEECLRQFLNGRAKKKQSKAFLFDLKTDFRRY